MSRFPFLINSAYALIASGHEDLYNESYPVWRRIAFARGSVRQAREALDEAAAQLPKPWRKSAVGRAFSVITSRR